MTQNQHDDLNPDRIDDPVTPDDSTDGTAAGDPVAGAKISEEAKDEAVEPDDNAFEVDGPQVGHA